MAIFAATDRLHERATPWARRFHPSWATGELTDPQPSQSHKTRPEVRRRRQSSTPPAAMRSFRAHHDSAATTPEGATRCLVTLERRRRTHAQSGTAPVQPNGLSRRCQPACQTPKCRRNVVSTNSAAPPRTPCSGGRWHGFWRPSLLLSYARSGGLTLAQLGGAVSSRRLGACKAR